MSAGVGVLVFRAGLVADRVSKFDALEAVPVVHLAADPSERRSGKQRKSERQGGEIDRFPVDYQVQTLPPRFDVLAGEL